MAWPPLPLRENLVQADHLAPGRVVNVPWSIHMIDQLQSNSADFPLPDQAGRCVCTSNIFMYYYSPYVAQLQPDPQVNILGDTVSWAFHDYLYDRGTMSGSSSGARPRLEFYKNRHDMVAEALGMTATDVQLRDIFGALDDDDVLTPDYAHQSDQGVIHILEFATSRDPSGQGLRQVLEMKMLKYRFALETRARETNSPVAFSVVVVSPGMLVSNVQLPQTTIDALGYRLKIACAIDDKASAQGIIFHEDQTEMSTREAEILHQLEGIGDLPAVGDAFTITEEYVRLSSGPLMPEDIETIKKQAISMLEDANSLMKESPMSGKEALKILHTSQSHDMSRSDQAAITVMPLFVVDPDKDPYDNMVRDTYISHFDCPLMLDIWRKAFESHSCIPESSLEPTDDESEDGLYEVYLDDAEVPKSDTKHRYCRVSITPSTDQRLYMAGKGIDGRRFRDHPYVERATKKSRTCFSQHVPLDDIDDYLTDNSWLKEAEKVNYTSYEAINSLLESADELHGNSGTTLDLLKRLYHTKQSVALQIVSKIAQELAISFKQHTKRDQFILKKVCGYPVYLLIKSVNTRSHIFFSILVPPGSNFESYGLPFTQFFSHEGFSYTTFKSFTVPKLSNQFVANELWLGSLIRWVLELSTCETAEKVNPTTLKPTDIDLRAVKMANLSLLVAMEDKASTEAEMTLSRYMYMEMFKSENKNCYPNPLKMVRKFNTYPRSRLLVWVQQNLIRSFSQMIVNPPVSRVIFNMREAHSEQTGRRVLVPEFVGTLPKTVRPTDVSLDRWDGLINCFTGDPVHNMSCVVNIMYTGYFKDKNENPWENSDWKLVEKVLEEEFRLDPKRTQYYGDSEPPVNDVRDHEFSPIHLKYGCDVASQQLQRKYGIMYKEELERLFVARLARISLVDLATLKASAVIADPSGLTLDSHEEVDTRSGRIKAMEAAAKVADAFSSHPYVNFEKAVLYVEAHWGAIACDLFKKQQHAGLREIYVLDFHCRIVQRFVEAAGRLLCEQFDVDTLSHPSIKHKLIDNHIAVSIRLTEDSTRTLINCNSSGDKTRWNQNIMVKAFAIIFSRMYTQRTAKALARCLNLWYGKLIKIPPGLQKLLINNTQLNNPIYEELLSQFWGDSTSSSPSVMEERTKFFRTVSGMFQGILHYTSSMLHVIERLSYKQLCHTLFTHRYPQYPLHVTVMCCSDDSCTMMSTAIPPDVPPEEKAAVKTLLTQLIFCQPMHGRYCNMRESVKSTLGTNSVLEYNSVFMCKGSVIVPTFKFWEAGLKVSQTESIKARLENMQNLLKSLSENSASAFECRMLQLLQASVFYKTLGADVNKHWPLLRSSLQKTHNIDLGFFPLDDELCPGMLGLKYNMYMASMRGEYLKPLGRLYQTGALDCTKGGELVSSFVLTFGNRKRLEKLQEEVECDPNWEELVNKHPQVLYRQPSSTLEAKLQITVSSHQAGVHESLNQGNSFFNSIVSSVYSPNCPCISVRQVSVENGKLSSTKVKTSLIGALKLQQTEPHTLDVAITDLFPNAKVFGKISLMLSRLKSEPLRLTPVPNLKRRLTTVLWQLDEELIEAPLAKSARLIWFGFKSKISSRTLKASWERQKEKIPWLRDDVNATLESSPFESHVALRNFIDSHGSVTRTIRVVCPPIRSSTFLSQLEDTIRVNYLPSMQMVSAEEKSGEERVYSSNISSEVSLVLLSPRPNNIKLQTIVNLMRTRQCTIRNAITLQMMPRQEAYLTVMHWVGCKIQPASQDYRRSEVEVLQATQMALDGLRNLKDTMVDFVVRRQSVDDEGAIQGPGVTRLYLKGCSVELEFEGDKVVRMYVPNLEVTYPHLSSIIEYVKWSGHEFLTEKGGGFFDDTIATISTAGLSAKRYRGTPISLNKDLIHWELDAKQLGMLLEVQDDTIRLISRQRYQTKRDGETMNYFQKDLVLCYYKASSVHLDLPKTQMPVVKEFDLAWMCGRPLDSVKLASIITYLRMKEESKDVNLQIPCPLEHVEDPEQLASWLRSTFKARIGATHGVFPTPTRRDVEAPSLEPMIDTLQLFGDEELMDDDWANALDDIIGALEPTSQEVQVDNVEPEQLDYLPEFDEEGLQAYMSAMSAQQAMGSTRETVFSHHQFWDDYIQDTETASPGALRRVAQGRLGVIAYLSDQLCWLMERTLDAPVSQTKLEAYLASVATDIPQSDKKKKPKAQSDIVPAEDQEPEPRVWRPSFRTRVPHKPSFFKRKPKGKK
uniref:RNA-directed RNA polymerase L n=1 Tax=Blatta orientalis phasmavirus 1 TaxID=3133445 RepID=A0AAT9JFH6_9VIRU